MKLEALCIVALLGGVACSSSTSVSPDAGTGGGPDTGGSPGSGGDSGSGGKAAAGGGAGDGGAGTGGSAAGSGGSAGSSTGGESGDGGDSTPPTVESTTPANGDAAVLAETDLVIQFSEPMATMATQSAFESSELLPATFAWNELGTVLTVNPSADLVYERGSASSQARSYSFTIGQGATDVAGNPLSPTTVTFSAARVFTMDLPRIEELTGYIISGSTPSVYVDPQAGDALDTDMKGFVSFDLGGLPVDSVGIASATLTATQYEVSGAPYERGLLQVEHVSFSNAALAFSIPALHFPGPLLSSATMLLGSLSVSSAVREDFVNRNARSSRTQFRFVFPTATNNGNNTSDYVRLLPVELSVDYLAP